MKIISAILIASLFFGCKPHETPKEETPKEETSEEVNTEESSKEETISFPLPDGFSGRGVPSQYIVYSDSVEKHNGHNVSTIKSVKPSHFATIISYIKPEKCIGKRIKYTAWVRSKDITGWAGLWLRIDPMYPDKQECLGFDNMSGRPIKGTKDWTMYEIVLDVPEGASDLVYGALLDGNGQLWVDSMDVKIVDKLTPRTDTFTRKFPKVL